MSEFEAGRQEVQPEEFELRLMQAMRRVDAPEGFAASVMERAAAPAAKAKVIVMRPRFATLNMRSWVGGAIAAMLLAGVFVGEHVRVRHERERAADMQFETATKITDHALEHARAQLMRAGVPLD